MVTYCAKFIPNFSDLTEPLRELTRKNVPFFWTSIGMLKPLTSATVMAYFDQTKETELITDADHLLVSQLFLHRKSQDQTNETLLHISVVRCRTLRDDTVKQSDKLLQLRGQLNVYISIYTKDILL
jgi:hypothetical protein